MKNEGKNYHLLFLLKKQNRMDKKKLSFCLVCKTLIGTVQQTHPLASSYSSLEMSCQSVRLFVSLEMTLILISLFLYMYVSLSASSFFFSYSSCSITSSFYLIESIERRRTSILVRAKKKRKSNTFVKK
jgi:hypothetical protein